MVMGMISAVVFDIGNQILRRLPWFLLFIIGVTVLLQDVTRLRRLDELKGDLVQTVAPVCAPAWRWYWSSTEEASA